MTPVLVIIPARTGSKGIPGKNFRALTGTGQSPVSLAVACALNLRWHPRIVISTDLKETAPWGCRVRMLDRPATLATDTTPMSAVVEHVLQSIPGPPNQIVVLLQPTQPLRRVKYVDQAIQWLRTGKATAVVSLTAADARLYTVQSGRVVSYVPDTPERRQVAPAVYTRDGTVYAVFRKNGWDFRKAAPLIVPSEDTCALDTLCDWEIATLRLQGHCK